MSKKIFGPCISPEMPISPPIIMHTSNPVYMVRKISFFIFKFGAAGLNQAKLADLWPEEGDFTEHVDWIWSVYCDWGLIGISGERQG